MKNISIAMLVFCSIMLQAKESVRVGAQQILRDKEKARQEAIMAGPETVRITKEEARAFNIRSYFQTITNGIVPSVLEGYQNHGAEILPLLTNAIREIGLYGITLTNYIASVVADRADRGQWEKMLLDKSAVIAQSIVGKRPQMGTVNVTSLEMTWKQYQQNLINLIKAVKTKNAAEIDRVMEQLYQSSSAFAPLFSNTLHKPDAEISSNLLIGHYKYVKALVDGFMDQNWQNINDSIELDSIVLSLWVEHLILNIKGK